MKKQYRASQNAGLAAAYLLLCVIVLFGPLFWIWDLRSRPIDDVDMATAAKQTDEVIEEVAVDDLPPPVIKPNERIDRR